MHLVFGYIDPGAGSLVIQAIIAGIVSIPFFFRNAIRKTVGRFRRGTPPKRREGHHGDHHRPGVTARPAAQREPGSYRDPSGFVFRRDGVLYRQINASFADDWRAFESSGLAADLIERRLLVPHQAAPIELAPEEGAVAVIQPEEIGFISYPYEWSFSQLKDAALLTLEAQATAASTA